VKSEAVGQKRKGAVAPSVQQCDGLRRGLGDGGGLEAQAGIALRASSPKKVRLAHPDMMTAAGLGAGAEAGGVLGVGAGAEAGAALGVGAGAGASEREYFDMVAGLMT
jgi:hypothetical protein